MVLNFQLKVGDPVRFKAPLDNDVILEVAGIHGEELTVGFLDEQKSLHSFVVKEAEVYKLFRHRMQINNRVYVYENIWPPDSDGNVRWRQIYAGPPDQEPVIPTPNQVDPPRVEDVSRPEPFDNPFYDQMVNQFRPKTQGDQE